MKITANALEGLFLFDGIAPSNYIKIVEKYSPAVCEYSKGDIIFSKEEHREVVGFVLSGECEVHRPRGERDVILNTLLPKSSFGILSVFSNEDYPTKIFARKNTAVLFFSKNDILNMCEEEPIISLNIIKFLSERIAFLNKKIAAYTGSSVEEMLATFLYNEYKKRGDSFPLNCKRCSETLGVGRASIYRALSSLISEELITFNEKQINIISPSGLERKTK